MPDIKIRVATPDDAPALVEIYAPYVTHTAISFEYEVPSAEEFAGRIRRTLDSYPYLIATAGGKPVGYAYAGPFIQRPAYNWAAETTVYIDESAHKIGVGRALYAALEQALAAQGVLNLNACIASPGQGDTDPYLTGGSVAFHQRLGWRFVGEFQRCGYKFGRWYNMLWMEKHIGSHLAEQPPVRTFDEVRESLVFA